MSIDLTDWDPSEYLDDEDAIQAYLNTAFEDGDPKLIASAIGDVARARGMTQIARDTGLAREALYRALSDKGNPELGTVIGVLKSLNLTMRVETIEPCAEERSIPEFGTPGRKAAR
ncbi:addiction module antidote protein [Methylobacterium sp. WL9]|uniref:addiction module antidote protein n=1 Tax=Methylobacterium sp. WL9 TaxID=2603898 RepID=UPI0011C9B598|nr:addiction module antidote protein [Methylobacterium sp. WL9]TXN19637.1 putative addiction module antidote protein [Methylobacterium sp. WL9]